LSKISIQQSTHLPVGSLNKNFIDHISARGVSLDYSYFITDNISAGLMVGYNDLYKKTSRQTYSYPETDISAVKSHSLQTTPLMLKVNYSQFKDGSPIQPYAGINAGVNLVSYQEWFGTLVDEANRLRFAVAPEIGARFTFTKYGMSGIDVSLRYHYTAFKYNDVKNLQTLSLNVGFFLFTRD
jgi:outer membrane protein W